MKQLNIKTPLMFSIVVTLLSALLITSHMVSGLYAKYSTTASGSSSARVAKISYHIYGQSSNHSFPNTSLHDGAVFAVEESFTVTNDGDVAFDYVLDLTLKDAEDQDIAGYTLLVPGSGGSSLSEIHVLNSNGSITEEYVPTGQFFCQRLENGEWTDLSSNAATISGTLLIGESHTYRIRYYIDMSDHSGDDTDVAFGHAANLNYTITCTQIY